MIFNIYKTFYETSIATGTATKRTTSLGARNGEGQHDEPSGGGDLARLHSSHSSFRLNWSAKKLATSSEMMLRLVSGAPSASAFG